MRKYIIIIVCCFAITLAGIFAFFCLRNRPIGVDNETTADELIENDYGLKRIYKLEALGRVYMGFDECNVNDLADECGVKLECKRQTGLNTFYYVVKGDGYRCFLFVDENDVLLNVMVTRSFVSQQEMKSIVEEVENFGNNRTIEEFSTSNLDTSYSLCRRAAGGDYLYFPLSDGMMIMRRPFLSSDESPEYFFYSNEEIASAKEYWKDKFSGWDWSSEILEIDRSPWQ